MSCGLASYPLTVALHQPTGFRCNGPSCRHRPIHSSQYYNPRHQPNKPLIGVSCPLAPGGAGALRTYSRTEYLQDIRTLNAIPNETFAPLTSQSSSSPTARVNNKRDGEQLSNSHNNMSDNKRPRVPCAGIPGVGPHLGKSKAINRLCTWEVCPGVRVLTYQICCRTQRGATGNKCYTHENAERSKPAPSTQPFLQTVSETAEISGFIPIPTSNNGRLNIPNDDEADLLGPPPPVHPLVLSPATMRTYHLNRSLEEEFKRAADAAEATCDRNISITLWIKEESEPMPFLFAPKMMKQYAISECEALVAFLSSHDPHWNKCLRVYDAKSDRWNYTLITTKIPMTSTLREGLVCLTTVEPKLCNGMVDLQSRLIPGRTKIKAIVDSLRVTPTKPGAPGTSFNSASSSISAWNESTDQSTPTPTPALEDEVGKGKGKRAFLPTPHRQQPPITPIFDDYKHKVSAQMAGRRPIFSHNILNDTHSPSPTSPFRSQESDPPMIDLTDVRQLSSSEIHDTEAMLSSPPPPTSAIPKPNHSAAAITAGSTAPSISLTLPTQPPGNAASLQERRSTRRTHKTGLWPALDTPMAKMTQWHAAHLTTKGKKGVWESFFSGTHKWNHSATFRYIRWMNEVTPERWAAWFEQCERNQQETTFEVARRDFSKELDAVW
ncbi:uncharacterized protein MELLADRAFT_96463 [Melampsora larici-populina 98AG31]|uniref:Uncharacterized protein n=1 Tax=Melampsora larici-populina (strain 98AG31 / pathotype 3-4-7) TaxID=747676 RepID=F4REY1_MELLP|nr:uncharacterized protein MELLADRAFT_96463 [Melampsora larici-populina 98AG31]EGG09208.1 hypothetical protein MELLADRAFT_96463 [Melampsora larici-populina 98AG31]